MTPSTVSSSRQTAHPNPSTHHISPLSSSIVSQIRSTINITSPTCVIRELVQNSIDAGAGHVDCWVMEDGEKLLVVDDGEGIGKEDMKGLGGRYATSKARDQSSLEKISTFGFRGEAIASISGMSEMKIISRHATSEDTYCKIIKGGKVIEFGKTRRQHRFKPGTTISVSNLFYNIPARRSTPSTPKPTTTHLLTFSSKSLKKPLEIIALGLPPDRPAGSVMITLTDEGSGKAGELGGKKVFEGTSARGGKRGGEGGLVETFGQMFGKDDLMHVKEINAKAKNGDGDMAGMRVVGFMSLQDHRSKAHQYIYLNGFHLERCELHEVVDGWMGKTSLGREDEDFAPGRGKQPYRKRRTPQPIYVLQMTIPPAQVDMAVDPKKNHAFVQDWQNLKRFMGKVVEDVLRESYLLSTFAPVLASGILQPSSTQAALSNTVVRSVPAPLSAGKAHSTVRSGSQAVRPLLDNAIRSNLGNTTRESTPARATWVQPFPALRNQERFSQRDENQRDLRDQVLAVGDAMSVGPVHHDCGSVTGMGKPAWLQEILSSTTRPKSPSTSLLSKPPKSFISQPQQPNRIKASRPPFQRETETLHDFDPEGIKITKAQLRLAKVIAQVDRKFILCHVPADSSPMSAWGGKAGSEACLVIIDQHAAHERIRVEKFIAEMCRGFVKDQVEVVDLGDEPHEIPMGEMELGFLREHEGARKLLRRWGIEVALMDGKEELTGAMQIEEEERFDGDSILFGPPYKEEGASSKPNLIIVHTVPKILENRLATVSHKEIKRMLREYIGALKEIEDLDRSVDKFFGMLDRSKAGKTQMETDEPDQVEEAVPVVDEEEKFGYQAALKWMPERMIELLNSNACRGAIMFNDPLTIPRCQELIDELALTGYPFMCAHGRQSISVICRLGSASPAGRKYETARTVLSNVRLR